MYTSDDLISAVKRYANVPTAQTTFQPTDFLALADDSIKAKLVPLIIKHCEEFYVRPYDYSVLANTSTYAIPTRAVNMMLRAVQLVDSTNANVLINLDRLNIEDLYMSMSGSRVRMQKNGFYLEGNNVVLFPIPLQVGGTLRLKYFIRPSQLVPLSSCAQILSINTGTNTITCVALPSTWSTANTFDLVKANPGFECTAIDQLATTVTGATITFTTTLPTNVSVGDYICLANQSCIVQVPPELQPLLFQYVVIRVLSAQGDANALKAAIAELEALEKNASILLAPRVQGSTKRVTNSRAINRLV